VDELLRARLAARRSRVPMTYEVIPELSSVGLLSATSFPVCFGAGLRIHPAVDIQLKSPLVSAAFEVLR
jgi:hypothetical protein